MRTGSQAAPSNIVAQCENMSHSLLACDQGVQIVMCTSGGFAGILGFPGARNIAMACCCLPDAEQAAEVGRSMSPDELSLTLTSPLKSLAVLK